MALQIWFRILAYSFLNCKYPAELRRGRTNLARCLSSTYPEIPNYLAENLLNRLLEVIYVAWIDVPLLSVATRI